MHFIRHGFMSLYYHRLRKLEGYHFGVLCCAVVAAVVLVVNLILTVWAVSAYEVRNGFGTLYNGSCKRTTSLTFWIHLAINVLSTLLLGASNYSMQCLSSPTRSEIDKAHGQGVWLDIGVPSIRNLRRLSTSRIVLWWLLAVSSVPLHLLYNSAVFSNLCTFRYTAFLVSDDFFDGAPFNLSGLLGMGSTIETNHLLDYQKNQTSLVRLGIDDCVKLYTAPLVSKYSDLFVVSNYSNSTNSILDLGLYLSDFNLSQRWPNTSGDWASMFRPYINGPLGPTESAETETFKVQFCLSKREKERCKLQFSLAIMIVVIVCNLIKTVCLSTIAWKQDPEPLVTLGDAIVSFLDRPDVTTEGNCITVKTRFEQSNDWCLLLSRWDQKRLRWFRAASRRRWLVCNIL